VAVANSVSACDLSLLGEVLDLCRQDGPEPPVQATFQVLHLITQLVGCDVASFQEMDSLTFERRHAQDVEDGQEFLYRREELAAADDDPGDMLLRSQWWHSPCSLIERTGRPVVTTTLSWYSEREWRQDPVHVEFMDFEDELIMGYPTSSFRSLRILLPRFTGPAFGNRELTLMELLLPHLMPLMAATVARETAPDPSPLTVRQQEILHLVRLGMPNKRIGKILKISEGTVRKHLENVFERLDVQSRTAAVAVAFGETAAMGSAAREAPVMSPPAGA
jgi:DNA-binding CsgD family transcriptional regulator